MENTLKSQKETLLDINRKIQILDEETHEQFSKVYEIAFQAVDTLQSIQNNIHWNQKK